MLNKLSIFIINVIIQEIIQSVCRTIKQGYSKILSHPLNLNDDSYSHKILSRYSTVYFALFNVTAYNAF